MDVRYLPATAYYAALLPWLLFHRPSGTHLRHLVALNPDLGPLDFFGVSRIRVSEILKSLALPQPRQVVRLATPSQQNHDDIMALISEGAVLIAKPEFGARSRGIQIIRGPDEIKSFLCRIYNRPVLVQEFVSGTEFSVRLVRKSDGVLRATMLVERKKLFVIGDGLSTFGDLATRVLDGYQVSKALRRHQGVWHSVPRAGERLLLTSLGIHSLGAQFVKSTERLKAVDEMQQRLNNLKGLNYCRIDFIVADNRQSYWILEINGCNAEPLEAYDEPIRLTQFYATFRRSLRERLQIGREVWSGRALPRPDLVVFGLIAGIERYLNA